MSNDQLVNPPHLAIKRGHYFSVILATWIEMSESQELVRQQCSTRGERTLDRGAPGFFSRGCVGFRVSKPKVPVSSRVGDDRFQTWTLTSARATGGARESWNESLISDNFCVHPLPFLRQVLWHHISRMYRNLHRNIQGRHDQPPCSPHEKCHPRP